MMNNLSESSRALIAQNNSATFTCSDPWLAQLRKSSLEKFSAEGLPTSGAEAWKYTSLKILDNIDSSNCQAAELNSRDLSWLPLDLKTHRLVFVNGRFNKTLSAINQLGSGVKVLSLSEALATEPRVMEDYLGQIGPVQDLPVLALNTAFIEDGLVVLIEGVALDKPVEVVFVSQGGGSIAHHPRNLVVAKDGAQITILERHVGIGGRAYLTNSVFEVLAEESSHVKHYRMLDDSEVGINLSTVKARVGEQSTYDSFVLSMGSRLSRSEIHVACEAEGAHTNLNGIYVARAEQHMDHTTLIEHLVPNTTSTECYKGALDEGARGVFQGSILVSDGADGTDARMSNKTLLLSDEAEIYAKPQLEIYADDVQCAHGCTAGELDEDALFYFCSRGIPYATARSMLVEGFLTEVIDSGVSEVYQVIFKDKIIEWMER